MSWLRGGVSVLLAVVIVTTQAACPRRPQPAVATNVDIPVTHVGDSEPVAVPGGTAPVTRPRKPPRDNLPTPADINPLNLEVTALEMLYQFQVTRPQLEQLAKLAPTTVAPAPSTLQVQVSAEYVASLKELHAALAENEDDRIAKASSAMEKIRAEENAEFEEVDITAKARERTAEFLRSLSPQQVTSYLVDYADEFPVPRQKILDALEEVRKAAGRDWEERRDEVAGQVGWLVGGLDVEAEDKVRRQVAQLLNRVHAMKDEEFNAALPGLEKSIDGIVGAAGPTDVIRHFVERSLAELLSNPRLKEAVKLRLENED
jgi:hypothetical protein